MFWDELKEFVVGHRDLIILPVLLLMLLFTGIIVVNRDTIYVPFIYSGF